MKYFNDLKSLPGLAGGYAALVLVLVLLLTAALSTLTGWAKLSAWFWLAIAPGSVMLVMLIIYYRRYPSTDGKAEPASTANGVSPDKRLDGDFAQLADKVQYLADMTALMLEKKQTLTRITLDPRVIGNRTTPNRQYLCFSLDGVSFAICTASVETVVEATPLIGKQGQAAHFRKAIRQGSSLVPVIDLGVQLGGRPIRIGSSTRIVILEVPVGDYLQKVGVLADAVGQILEVPLTRIQVPTTPGNTIKNGFLLGTVTFNDCQVILLDIGRGLMASDSVILRALSQSSTQEGLPA